MSPASTSHFFCRFLGIFRFGKVLLILAPFAVAAVDPIFDFDDSMAVPVDRIGHATAQLASVPLGVNSSHLVIHDPLSTSNSGEAWSRSEVLQEENIKTARDDPLHANSDLNAVVRFILTPKQPNDGPATWREINILHESLKTRVVKTLTELGDIQIVEVPAESANACSNEYKRSGYFASVELDAQVEMRSSDPLLHYNPLNYVPYEGDPQNYASITYQWSMKNTGEAIQAYQRINGTWVPYGAPEYAATNASLDVLDAWDYINNSAVYSDCRIGLIDSGITTNHPDLANVVATDANGNPVCFSAQQSGSNLVITENDLNTITDSLGHGTEMAGIVAANCNNGIGISGVAPGAKILVAKTGFLLSEVIAAINWEVENDADVINCSWGFSINGGSPSLLQAVAAAQQKGIIMVCAVANQVWDYDLVSVQDYPPKYKKTPLNPTGLDNIVNVTDTMASGQLLPGGAGYGKHTVDFGVPGRRLPTTSNNLSVPYVYISGTSVAAAETSACVAVLKHLFPNEDHRAIIGRLHSGIVPAPPGDLLNNTICAGSLNLFKAVTYQPISLEVAWNGAEISLTICYLLPGHVYTLQSSSDLVIWVQTNQFIATGATRVISVGTENSMLFYRVACP